MDRNAFLSAVRNRAPLEDDASAEQATRAVFEVLSRRLFGGEVSDLAAQLPPEISDYLQPPEANETFEAAEFVEHVAEREDINTKTAGIHVRAVLAATAEAVSTGEILDVLSQLPDEFAGFFPPEIRKLREEEERKQRNA